jgi:type II secretory pathway predicted ATPase ExeA
MYEAYWQMSEKPFENCSDSRFYYPAEPHQAALLKLRYTVENRGGAALLAGAAGVGKTFLIQLLKRHLPEQFYPLVHLVYPQMPTQELLGYLADELGAPASANPRRTIEESVRRLQTCLTENARAGRHAVVVVDEAHLLEDSRSLEAIRLLLNFEFDSHPTATFLLVAHPEFLPAVDRMPQLEERLSVKCVLRPMTADETAGYVSHRLSAAGCQRTIFDMPALEALHGASRGLPRRINRLCELALLIGFAEERETIGAEHVEAVSQELTAAIS